MREIPWVTLTAHPDKAGRVHVRYYCQGGFSLDKEVDADVANIIRQAIEYGKHLRSEELRKLLGINQ